MRNKVIQEKVDELWLKELVESLDIRFKRDMDEDAKKKRRPLSVGEGTRMIRNTEHWKGVKEELVTKPRKKE